MNLPSPPTQTVANFDVRGENYTQLRGHWLVFARIVWIALVVSILVVFFASLSVYISQLQTVCAGGSCAFNQLSPEEAHALRELGLSVSDYAINAILFTIVSAFVWFTVGGIIFWRKSDDWLALLFALMLVLGGTLYVTETVLASRSIWRVPALLLNELTFVLIFLVFSLFPDGRFIPRWTRWLFIGYLVLEAPHIYTLLPDSSFDQIRYPPLLLLLWFGELACLGVAQIYRYRYVSGPTQRQQTKWVVFSMILAMTIGLVLNVPALLFRSVNSLSILFAAISLYPLVLIIPLSIGIAVLRYRLWDIDILINRTLVYGTLTSILALVYLGLVFTLQFLLRGIVNQDSPIAIVAATLVIAALFQPLRHRIQGTIDRRFYRRKYDAARILAAFSATLRNEVDLNQLNEHLIAVVEETMQPTHVSLWLRKPERHEEHKAGVWGTNPPAS
ncbi:MAG TPA: hypothetical protein VF026_03010 [Ktedonobacteraceae bacterium]